MMKLLIVIVLILTDETFWITKAKNIKKNQFSDAADAVYTPQVKNTENRNKS